ncbi:hypothetical protein TrRE_jg5798, partial [Triparma retinervis]
MLFTLLAFLVVQAGSSTITGVNLGGWLLIEEWMFSNGQFDRVAEKDDLPQGVIMPPLLPDGPGFNWFSEGDLISRLADEFSPDFAVEVQRFVNEGIDVLLDIHAMPGGSSQG